MTFQERIQEKNKTKIIQVLLEKPLRFKDLITATGFSRAMVNRHLQSLVNQGIVKKIYDSGKLQLLNVVQRDADRVKPLVFASMVKHYITGQECMMMEEKWSPENAKKNSEKKVLKTFYLHGLQLRWSDLLGKAGLSSRTLKNALDRLKKMGLVYREVKAEDGYPPPVLYGLTEKGEKTSREEKHKKTVSLMVKRIGVAYLVSLLKMVEEQKDEWFTTTWEKPNPVHIFSFFLKQRLPKLLASKDHAFTIPEEAIDGLRQALQQTFPEEMGQLDQVIKEVNRGGRG